MPRRRELRPQLLAAVVRSDATLAFAAERQVISRKRSAAMAMYEPSKKPNAEEWLALDEGERIELVRAFHRREKIFVPNLDAHAIVHAVVENQLAEGFPAATATLARLQSEGLNRHDAVHAIGSVLLEHMQNLMNGSRSGGDPNAPYATALERLTADAWRRSG